MTASNPEEPQIPSRDPLPLEYAGPVKEKAPPVEGTRWFAYIAVGIVIVAMLLGLGLVVKLLFVFLHG